MKARHFSLSVLVLSACLISSTQAQPFTTLYPFTGMSDGGFPRAGLVQSGATLYGTASSGSQTNSYGTVFSINTDGTGFTNLYTFTNGIDGSVPVGGLVVSGGTLFGTASHGGSSSRGTIFSLSTGGTGF